MRSFPVLFLALLCFAVTTARADSRELSFYKRQSETTSPGKYAHLYNGLPRDPAELAKVVQGLIMHGGLGWLYKHQPTKDQLHGFTAARSVEAILANVRRLDDAPLTVSRPIEKRTIGNCRSFSVLMISMLRHQGVPARMRVGYSTYTAGPDKLENHFIVEYWNGKRWVMLDAQIDQAQRDFHKIDFSTTDLPAGKFVVAGKAWQDLAKGKIAASTIGMYGPKGWEGFGWRMLHIDILADAWALNKVELFTGETNDLGAKAHDKLSPNELRLLTTLASSSADSDQGLAGLRSLLNGSKALRVDLSKWKP